VFDGNPAAPEPVGMRSVVVRDARVACGTVPYPKPTAAIMERLPEEQYHKDKISTWMDYEGNV